MGLPDGKGTELLDFIVQNRRFYDPRPAVVCTSSQDRFITGDEIEEVRLRPGAWFHEKSLRGLSATVESAVKWVDNFLANGPEIFLVVDAETEELPERQYGRPGESLFTALPWGVRLGNNPVQLSTVELLVLSYVAEKCDEFRGISLTDEDIYIGMTDEDNPVYARELEGTRFSAKGVAAAISDIIKKFGRVEPIVDWGGVFRTGEGRFRLRARIRIEQKQRPQKERPRRPTKSR